MKPYVLIGVGSVVLAIAVAVLSHNADPSGPLSRQPSQETAPSRRPEKARPPTRVPSETGTPPTDYAEELRRLSTSGDSLAVQIALTNWFAADPEAARDWLGTQPTFTGLQKALAQIATDMATEGQPINALEWAELLDSGPHREETIFQIYAKGRRYQSFTEEQIRAAPFSPERIAMLLSGAGDD